MTTSAGYSAGLGSTVLMYPILLTHVPYIGSLVVILYEIYNI